MRNLARSLLQQLSSELALLCSDMLELESSLLERSLVLHEAHRRSARNLAHYLALRQHDVRKLQSQLALLGLSSLGRTESHVLNAVQTVHRVLNVLLGADGSLPSPAEPAVEIGEGAELLEPNTDALLGPPHPEEKFASWSPWPQTPPRTMHWCATSSAMAWIACASTVPMTNPKPGS